MDAIEQSTEIPAAGVALEAEIAVPVPAWGMVLLVQAESPARGRSEIGDVAAALQDAGLATTVLGLLRDEDEWIDASRSPDSCHVHPLGERAIAVIDWLVEHEYAPGPDIGLLGTGLGASAALIAASARPLVAAIVACGDHRDLAATWLRQVRQPTLLIVGDHRPIVGFDRLVQARTGSQVRLEMASVDVEEVARLARDWFVRHLRP